MFKNKYIFLLTILNIFFYSNLISSFLKNKYTYGSLFITSIGINEIYNIKENEKTLYENNLKLFLLQKKIKNLPETKENKILVSEINNYFKYQNSLFDITLEEIPKKTVNLFKNICLSNFILNKTINDYNNLIFSNKKTILKNIKQKEKLKYFEKIPYLIEINIHETSILYNIVEFLENNKSLQNIIKKNTNLDLLNININNKVGLIIKNKEYNTNLNNNFYNLINEIDSSFYELKKNELEYEKFCKEYNNFNNKNGPILKKINIELSDADGHEIKNYILYALKLIDANNFQNYNKTQTISITSSNLQNEKTIINLDINENNNNFLRKLGFYKLSELGNTVEINEKLLLRFNKVN